MAKEYRTLSDVIKRLVRIDRILCCCSGCEEGGAQPPNAQDQELWRGITENNTGTPVTTSGTLYIYKVTSAQDVYLPEIGDAFDSYSNTNFIARIKNSAESTHNITVRVGAGGDDHIENSVATSKVLVPGEYVELIGAFDGGDAHGVWIINAAYVPIP